MVNWTAVLSNEANGIITKYLINMTANTSFGFSMDDDFAIIDDTSMYEYLFTGLEESMEYTFVISAFTRVGKGPTSPNVSSTTEQLGTYYSVSIVIIIEGGSFQYRYFCENIYS